MDTPRRTVGVVLAAVVVAVAGATWGWAGRDLAGDELNMLHGTPGQILAWSLDPRGGFVGHLPLSFWARWVSLTVFSETPAWAWRVHAVLATAAAAGLTAATALRHFGTRAALVAGVLLAIDPIVAFHSQEASNYAASVLVGALIVRGVLDLSTHNRHGAGWLAAGLLMGASNDFYSVLVAIPAGLVCLFLYRTPALRRPLLTAWVVPLVAVAPFAILFVLRLFESTGSAVLDVHADPLPPRPLPALLDAPWRVSRRFFGAHMHGYAGGRNDTPWLGLPPVLLGLLACAATFRTRAWPAAVLVVGGLTIHGLLGVGLQVSQERILPFEPRSLIGLTPALVLAIAGLSQPRLGRAVALIWALATGLSTLEARLSPANLRDQALEYAQSLDVGPLVIDDARTRTRLPTAVPCAEGLPAVWVTNHTATEATLPTCGAAPIGLLTHRTFFDAPVHEGSAASFLPRRVVAVAGAPVSPRPIQVQRALFDGLDGVMWEHTDATGALLTRGPHPSTFEPQDTGWQAISALPTAPPWLPDHLLFRAFRNQVQAFELDPLDQRPTLRAAPMRSPTLATLRHLLPVLGTILAMFALFRRPR